jgi:hypothetical protein
MLRGEADARRGLTDRLSFLAAALAWRKTVARLARMSLGELSGELLARGLVAGCCWPEGLGGTAGGIVARFIGGE